MNRRRTPFCKAGIVCLAVSLWIISAAAQSVVNTINYSPPGITNNVAFDFEVGVVHSTGLVYIGSTAVSGNDVGVIDPVTNSVSQVIPLPTGGQLNFARVNQATGLVYFRQPNSNIVVVDGRPSSLTFNQALPTITLPGRQIQSYALDEIRGLLYVTNNNSPPAVSQSFVSVIDANPSSATFHTVLDEVMIPVGVPPPTALARGIAVNSVTNKIYVGVSGGGIGGVYLLDGVTHTLGLVPGSNSPTIGVIVNESANLVYATTFNNQITAVDGNTNTTIAMITVPGLFTFNSFDERLAVNRVTGRVYFRGSEVLSPGKVVVIDGDRASATFNTVLAAITVGRENGRTDLVVDEALNRVITTSSPDMGTTIIDGATNSVVATIKSSQLPADVALDPSTHRAYVPNQQNIVQEINVGSASLEATIITASEAGPGAVNPNSHRFYTTRTIQHSDVLTFDKCGIPATVSGLPHNNGRYLFAEVNRNTNRVYVTNGSTNITGDMQGLPGFVSVIDGATDSVIANVAAGHQPFGLAVNEATNKIYVLNAGVGVEFPSGITVIDGATNVAVAADTSAFPPNALFFRDMAVNETTNRIYFQVNDGAGGAGVLNGATNVATPLALPAGQIGVIRVNKVLNRIYLCTTANTLHVLDGANDSLITSIPIVSPGTPAGRQNFMAVNETTGQVFISDFNNDTVTVVDGLTNSIVATIPVGNGPVSLFVNELSNRVYVTNVNDSTISFIDAATMTVDATLALPLRAISIEGDPATSRLYLTTGSGLLQSGVMVVSDTDGTFDSLRQAITAATAGDPPGIRNSLLNKADSAQGDHAQGDNTGMSSKLKSLEHGVEAQRGKRLTDAEADLILALISAIANSVC